jgi:hypothetical protein
LLEISISNTDTLFWKDRWLDGRKIKDIAPNIYAMVPKRVINRRRTCEALQNMSWTWDLRGALTVAVFVKYVELYQQLDGVVLQQGVPDSHVWKLSASGQYFSNSAYKALFQGAVSFGPADRVWKTWAPAKCKFFMWLVEHNKCWTTDKLGKRGMDHSDHCPLCDQQEESINHLLISCVFVRQLWDGLLRAAGLQELAPQLSEMVLEDWWRVSSHRVMGQIRSGFNTLVILGSWVLWKHKNNCLFDGS